MTTTKASTNKDGITVSANSKWTMESSMKDILSKDTSMDKEDSSIPMYLLLNSGRILQSSLGIR